MGIHEGDDMTVPTGAVIRASARFVDTHGSDVVNVYFFRSDFDTPQSEAAVFAGCDQYLASVYTEFDANLDDDFDPLDLKVDVVEWDSVKWQVVANVGFGGWGVIIDSTALGNPLAPGVAALVSMFTGLGKHTGRKFVGGLVEAIKNSEGNFATASAAAMQVAFSLLLTPKVLSVGNDLITVVLDHTDGTIRDVIAIGVSEIFGYQRRRRPGTGS